MSRHYDSWAASTWAIAALVGLPVVAVLVHVLLPATEVWDHLVDTVLSRYIVNTLLLTVGVGVLVLTMGVGSAWLVAMCRFPDRHVFEWALLLPLAIPT